MSDARPATPDGPRLTRLRGDNAHVRTVALVVIAFAVILFLLVQARFILISLAAAIIPFSLMSDAIDAIAWVRCASRSGWQALWRLPWSFLRS